MGVHVQVSLHVLLKRCGSVLPEELITPNHVALVILTNLVIFAGQFRLIFHTESKKKEKNQKNSSKQAD
jgi:hypothetical protein